MKHTLFYGLIITLSVVSAQFDGPITPYKLHINIIYHPPTAPLPPIVKKIKQQLQKQKDCGNIKKTNIYSGGDTVFMRYPNLLPEIAVELQNDFVASALSSDIGFKVKLLESMVNKTAGIIKKY